MFASTFLFDTFFESIILELWSIGVVILNLCTLSQSRYLFIYLSLENLVKECFLGVVSNLLGVGIAATFNEMNCLG